MSKRKKQKKETFPYKLLPIIAVLCLLPLIVYAKPIVYDVSQLSWYSGNSTTLLDIFNYYKSVILQISAFVMLVILLKRHLIDKTRLNHKHYSPAYAYIVLVALSAIFSISPYFSRIGYINHLENVFVLISYMIVFIYTAESITKEAHLQWLINGWMISIGLLFLIGLTQFLGFDLYRTNLGLNMIVPASLRSQIADVDFTLWSDNLIYQSLFHYNYVSFYSAVAFPFFLALFIGTKQVRQRILYALIMVILIFNLFGSQGRNGLVGVAFGTLIVLVFYGRQVLLNKYTLTAIGTLIAGSILFVTLTDTVLERRVLEAFTGLSDTIDHPLNNLIMDGSTLIIDHDDYYLEVHGVTKEDSAFYSFTNSLGDFVQTNQIDNAIELTGEDGLYDNLSLSMLVYQEEEILQLQLENVTWNFLFIDNEFIYLNPFGKKEQLTTIPSMGFKGAERWGSQRGYIWSRTFPMIIARPLLGYGPDTYTIAFPQNDYVGKLAAFGSSYVNTVVDKPHNIYLNYAVNTGIPSMIAILIIFTMAYVLTFKNYMNSTSNSLMRLVAIASIGAITGYLTAGVFNDTSLHVTPILWVIVGMNYASNHYAYQKGA